MISRLFIKNYAIIDELDIRFSNNLTIITGETGAGKSIMLGALGLIMGRRADSRTLYNTDEKCFVEGYFNIKDYNLREFFEENDLDYEEEIVIRREITTAGKSRASINGSPVVLEVIQKLSDSLLDLHQQFDTLDIQSPAFQIQVIDALAGNHALLKEWREKYNGFKNCRTQLEDLNEKNKRSVQEADYLGFQLEEFNKIELIEGEQEHLESENMRLTNAESIKRSVGGAFQALTESEEAISGQLSSVSQLLSSVTKFHPEIPALKERLDSVIYEIQDLSGEFEKIAEETEYDGNRIQEVQNRLNAIYKLQKKHNVSTVEELIAIQEDLQKKLKSFSSLSEEIIRLEKELQTKEKELLELGKTLSSKRVASIPAFEKELHRLLHEVAMENARLQVELIPGEEILPNGTDKLKFLFAANKGSRMDDIKGSASGGEMSRLAFCVKSLVAHAIPLPTMIFDEIDSGVSGDVAMKMGVIMHQLAAQHQVVCITHSPQVASRAHKHYFVYKRNEADRTYTEVRPLEGEERVIEIAKMLSGNPPSETAKQNARELLEL